MQPTRCPAAQRSSAKIGPSACVGRLRVRPPAVVASTCADRCSRLSAAPCPGLMRRTPGPHYHHLAIPVPPPDGCSSSALHQSHSDRPSAISIRTVNRVGVLLAPVLIRLRLRLPQQLPLETPFGAIASACPFRSDGVSPPSRDLPDHYWRPAILGSPFEINTVWPKNRIRRTAQAPLAANHRPPLRDQASWRPNLFKILPRRPYLIQRETVGCHALVANGRLRITGQGFDQKGIYFTGVRTIVSVLVAVSIAHSAPAFDSVTAFPLAIQAGGATIVTVTALISDQSPIAASPNVLQLDAKGKTLSILGAMHDDGKGGDAVAGYRIFTLQLTLTPPQPGIIYLRVSAVLAGVLRRIQSASIPITLNPTAVLPANPSTLVTPLSKFWLNTARRSTSFLCSGPNPIQTGVGKSKMIAAAAGVVRGRVLTGDDQPLRGIIRLNIAAVTGALSLTCSASICCGTLPRTYSRERKVPYAYSSCLTGQCTSGK